MAIGKLTVFLRNFPLTESIKKYGTTVLGNGSGLSSDWRASKSVTVRRCGAFDSSIPSEGFQISSQGVCYRNELTRWGAEAWWHIDRFCFSSPSKRYFV